MARKNKTDQVVYSTYSDFEMDVHSEEENETLAPSEQVLEIHLDKKNRGGKMAVVIKHFQGKSEDLNALGKKLKAACGVGGSVKNKEIIIQGNKREKVMELLKKWGYQTKRVGS